MADTLVNKPVVPQSVATTGAMDVSGAAHIYVQMAGTYTATIDVQLSNDGTNWVTSSSATGLTSGTLTSVPERCKYMRLNVTAYTSGAPIAAISVTKY